MRENDIKRFIECATVNDPGYIVTFNVGDSSDVIAMFLLKEDAERFADSFGDPLVYFVERI